MSMPDISSYAAQQDAEEAKRRKRLARNRASARLRRLKKKNLVSRVHSLVRHIRRMPNILEMLHVFTCAGS